MADCIYAQVVANLKTTLRGVTAENGYNTNVHTVEQLRATMNFSGRYPFVLILENELSPESEYDQVRDDTYNFLIWYFGGENDDVQGNPNLDNDTEFTYRNRNVAADITKALMVDVTRGNVAQYTSCGPWDHDLYILDDGSAIPGTYLYVRVHCTTNPNDPYST